MVQWKPAGVEGGKKNTEGVESCCPTAQSPPAHRRSPSSLLEKEMMFGSIRIRNSYMHILYDIITTNIYQTSPFMCQFCSRNLCVKILLIQQQKLMSEHTSQRSNCWRSSQHWFVMEMFLSWWKYFWLLLWKYNSVRGRTQPALFSISCWI